MLPSPPSLASHPASSPAFSRSGRAPPPTRRVPGAEHEPGPQLTRRRHCLGRPANERGTAPRSRELQRRREECRVTHGSQDARPAIFPHAQCAAPSAHACRCPLPRTNPLPAAGARESPDPKSTERMAEERKRWSRNFGRGEQSQREEAAVAGERNCQH